MRGLRHIQLTHSCKFVGFGGRPKVCERCHGGKRRAVGRSATHMPCWAHSDAAALKVWAVSDIHTDYNENMDWVKSLSRRGFGESDVLLLAGDAAEDIRVLRQTLAALRATFGRVFFCAGNHELWVRGEPDDPRNGGATDSFEKLQLIMQLCAELNVSTRPERLGDTWVVPLASWHHRSWDREPDIPGASGGGAFGITDYAACRWPPSVPGHDKAGSLGVAEWIDARNDGLWDESQRDGCDVITMAHMLPQQVLLPEKRFLYFPQLAKAVGSDPLAARLAALRPDIHVFGHTHFSWNSVADGVRYVQAPLATPAERQRRLPSLTFRRPGDDVSERSAADARAADLVGSRLPLLVYEASAAPNAAAPAAAAAQQPRQAGRDSASGGEIPAAATGPEWLRHGRSAGHDVVAHWSEYYKQNRRDPSVVAPRPFKRQRRKHATDSARTV